MHVNHFYDEGQKKILPITTKLPKEYSVTCVGFYFFLFLYFHYSNQENTGSKFDCEIFNCQKWLFDALDYASQLCI